MPHLALSFELAGIDPTLAEDACFELGATAVSLFDCEDDPVLEPLPGEVRLWRRTRLEALFAAEAAGPELITALAQALGVEASDLHLRHVADRVWEREWLKDFHAMRFGRRLWVCPQHESVEEAAAVVVQLDPGLAFGTGTHASTALCLEWLDGAALSGRQVIDFGCGSGILGIAALKLGAKAVFAFDIDPQALLASTENAARNGVADRLRLCDAVGQLPPNCNLLLANILSNVLMAHAQPFAQLLGPAGELLLAGILVEQEGEVMSAFSPWFEIRRVSRRDDWVALHATRR